MVSNMVFVVLRVLKCLAVKKNHKKGFLLFRDTILYCNVQTFSIESEVFKGQFSQTSSRLAPSPQADLLQMTK